jgi:flagellar motility protein MotE (MotC chaperone)
MRKRFRLLPLVIFAAALTLTLKVGTIWNDARIGVAKPSIAKVDKGDKGEKIDKGDAKEAAAKTAEGEKGDSPAAAEAADKDFDVSQATDAEIDILEKLAARRRALDKRGGELDMREALLKATENRIDTKIAELQKIKSTIEGLLKKHDKEQEEKMKRLVKIYENMKPKDAARIFERLNMKILLDVVERMREAKTAPILANMDPEKANVLTTELAARRVLPSTEAAGAAPKPDLTTN